MFLAILLIALLCPIALAAVSFEASQHFNMTPSLGQRPRQVPSGYG